MDLGLGGKRVLITGGSRGIGFACARAFLAEGADVTIAARDAARLAAAKGELGGRAQGKVETVAIDMGAPGAAGKLIAAAGEIDILVNNAGAIPGGDILAIDEAKWRAAWDLKVFGYVNLAREAFARMKAKNRGVIVNVIGLGGERHNFNYVAGAAGNAGLMSFTHAMGAHSTDHGIRVVGVNPGLVATERMEFLMRIRAKNELGDGERWKELVGKLDLPFGRPATADEVASVVVFLASDRAGYISGDVVRVDGGALHRGK